MCETNLFFISQGPLAVRVAKKAIDSGMQV